MNDVFISYAHLDDQALSEGQRGWIREYDESFGAEAKELTGK